MSSTPPHPLSTAPTEGGESRVRLLLTALIAAGAVYAATLIFMTTTNGDVPNDFGQFFVAAQLVKDGQVEDLYEITEFRAAIADSAAFADDDLTSIDTLIRPFGYPPLLPQALRPLTVLEPATAHLIYLVLGAVFFWYAISRIGARPLPTVLIVVGFPLALVIDLGQNTLWSAGFLAMGVSASLKDKERIAGAWWGLLVFKPQILLALVVSLWVSGGRRRSSAITAGVVGSGLILLSIALDLSAWATYLPRSLALASTPDAVIDLLRVGAFDLGSIFTTNRIVALGIGMFIAGGALYWLARRTGSDSEILAASLVVMVWITPWSLLYDWLLAVVPALMIAGMARSQKKPIGTKLIGAWVVFVWVTALSAELYRFLGQAGLQRLRLVSIVGGVVMLWAASSLTGQKGETTATG